MKKVITIILTVLAASVVGTYLGLWNFYIDRIFLANLIVFHSIVFGFCVTGLSVISTSKFVSRLYQFIDPADPSITLLHRLVYRFKASLYFSLASLIYFYLLDAHLANLNHTLSLDVRLVEMSPFVGVILLNIYFAFSILETLSLIIIQEGKLNEVNGDSHD